MFGRVARAYCERDVAACAEGRRKWVKFGLSAFA
jgi:hypothetical protein